MIYLRFKWTVSRGRETNGWNVCTLFADGDKVARTCGGGYDMKGTVLGDYVAKKFAKELEAIKREMYGLTWHDPKYDPGTYVPKELPWGGKNTEKKTVYQLEKEGESLGLERYQSFYRASNKVRTKRHVIPLMDGGCGFSCMTDILREIGYQMQYLNDGKRIADQYMLFKEGEKLG